MSMHHPQKGWTPLHNACVRGHVKVAEMLLKHGVNTKAKDDYGRAPLHYACEKGHVKVVEMLLKHGVDAKARDDVSNSIFPDLLEMYGRTAVHYACDQVYVKVLEMLVEHGADAKAMDDVSTSHLLFRLMMYGRTPLHYACHTGRVMVVLMLLEHGVDAKAQNKVNTSLFPINLPLLGGRAPLHYACYNGHVKVVETLLEHGVDAEAKDERGETAFDAGRRRGHANRLEPVFAAHEARLAQLFAWLPPLPSPAPSLESVREGSSTGGGSCTSSSTFMQSFQRDLAGGRCLHSNTALNWPAFKATITRALGVLDQAVQVPEALQGCLSQLDPNIDNLESVLEKMQSLTEQIELQPVYLELQNILAKCPAPATAPTTAFETPPTDFAAALGKLVMLHNVEPERQERLTSTNTNIKRRVLALIDALDVVAKAGTTDTALMHRVDTLRQRAQCSDVSAPLSAKSLPEAWEQLCQAHERLSSPKQNGLEQLADWRAEHDYEHQDWYLAFVLHETQALLQQLHDMIDWQAKTLSVVTLCEEYASSITQSSADQVVSIHEEVAELQKKIQATTAFLAFVSDDMRAGIQANLDEEKERLSTLQQQLSKATQVDQLAALAELLHQHFPALLIFLHPEHSALGVHLRKVLGPDLPASLILEAMTEVDQVLTLSCLGQLELHYNQNHKVYKARAALPNRPEQEQDLAVKEYAFAQQHKQNQCRTFLRELRAMRQLEHPNIVPVFGALVGVHDGHPSAYLVQPWCTQGDLQQWLGKARHLATSTVVASLMTQLRMALAFMHSKGLVHRDVKLSNVMLDGDEDQPVVRLGDFDIAKAAAEATMLPCTATASLGTTGYVAPELLFGMGRVGARPAQDAFSFGCVLYNTYMFPQTVPPARLPTDQLADQCTWDAGAGGAECSFPHLAAEMCNSTSELYKETRALLATDPKQRPILFSAGQRVQRPVTTQAVGPAIDVLRDAPELIPEVVELLQQLGADGREPSNIAVRRVERVQNPVLWERYSAKRWEMLHRITSQEHYDQLHTATSHQYATPGANGERMLIITRALLGRAYVHPSPPFGALAPPLLPDAPNNERFDSVIATPQRTFREVILFDNAQIYPELVVYYTA
ncbi:uncharacterized protein MONBRDRAFT_30431 [Monosiga brevicollis MX1]|uniref:Protein kinase domain-containing protein n=1 Tax=Monosiga brevicollis TaxID=81824 RepID=A9VDY0_MONBE|nr:uncharacterized protein MONBRDRAFT_30431 [Monosiga brevicollis MX1]EDQ84251.1 predicted protein [Monosiga brevicollis MX1]|eukprot:XP_001750926.1 hypothetical protein [Monosiga brevicollis MX1]